MFDYILQDQNVGDAMRVLIGRLQMYALAVAGALGVAHMLQLLTEELHACMAQAGCAQPYACAVAWLKS